MSTTVTVPERLRHHVVTAARYRLAGRAHDLDLVDVDSPAAFSAALEHLDQCRRALEIAEAGEAERDDIADLVDVATYSMRTALGEGNGPDDPSERAEVYRLLAAAADFVAEHGAA